MSSKVFFVLGMHRSGTSALTGMLDGNCFNVPQDQFDVDVGNNDLGFKESKEVVHINNVILGGERKWKEIKNFDILDFGQEKKNFVSNLLDVFLSKNKKPLIKDPRLCITFPIWKEYMDVNNIEYDVVTIFRHPLEVSKSLYRRNGMSVEFALRLWFIYNFNIVCNLDGLKYQAVDYDDLLEKTEDVNYKLVEFYGLRKGFISKFVDGKYRHIRNVVDMRDDFYEYSIDLYNDILKERISRIELLKKYFNIYCHVINRKLEFHISSFHHKNIYIYGYGETGRRFHKSCDVFGIKIAGIVGGIYDTVSDSLTLDEISFDNSFLVVCSTFDRSEIEERLTSLSLVSNEDYCFYDQIHFSF